MPRCLFTQARAVVDSQCAEKASADELRRARQEVVALEHRVHTLEGERAALRGEIAALKVTLERLRAEYTASKSECEAGKAREEAGRVALKGLRYQGRRLQAEVSAALGERDALSGEVEEMIDAAEAERDALESGLASAKVECEALRLEVVGLRKAAVDSGDDPQSERRRWLLGGELEAWKVKYEDEINAETSRLRTEIHALADANIQLVSAVIARDALLTRLEGGLERAEQAAEARIREREETVTGMVEGVVECGEALGRAAELAIAFRSGQKTALRAREAALRRVALSVWAPWGAERRRAQLQARMERRAAGKTWMQAIVRVWRGLVARGRCLGRVLRGGERRCRFELARRAVSEWRLQHVHDAGERRGRDRAGAVAERARASLRGLVALRAVVAWRDEVRIARRAGELGVARARRLLWAAMGRWTRERTAGATRRGQLARRVQGVRAVVGRTARVRIEMAVEAWMGWANLGGKAAAESMRRTREIKVASVVLAEWGGGVRAWEEGKTRGKWVVWSWKVAAHRARMVRETGLSVVVWSSRSLAERAWGVWKQAAKGEGG